MNWLARLVEPARWIIIGGIAFTLANTVLFFIAAPTPAPALDLRQPARSNARHPSRRQHQRDPQSQSVRRGRRRRRSGYRPPGGGNPPAAGRCSACSSPTSRKNRRPSSRRKQVRRGHALRRGRERSPATRSSSRCMRITSCCAAPAAGKPCASRRWLPTGWRSPTHRLRAGAVNGFRRHAATESGMPSRKRRGTSSPATATGSRRTRKAHCGKSASRR